MTGTFIVKSVQSDAVLEFTQRSRDGFLVAFRHSDCQGTVKVWCRDEVETLVVLFSKMAENWRGWDGKLEWMSIEHEFDIEAVSDGKGHAELKVTLDNFLKADPWRLNGALTIEAGQFDQLAHDSKQFFFVHAL